MRQYLTTKNFDLNLFFEINFLNRFNGGRYFIPNFREVKFDRPLITGSPAINSLVCDIFTRTYVMRV